MTVVEIVLIEKTFTVTLAAVLLQYKIMVIVFIWCKVTVTERKWSPLIGGIFPATVSWCP